MNQDTEKKKIWVSDVINGEQSQWKIGDFVIINAGTGTGKSHFIRNELYEEARSMGERILFISNRDKLKIQNMLGIKGKEDTITPINYQAIENHIMNGEKFNFDLFKYVVCDEAHYFLTDSGFNRNNDLSMNAILGIKKSVVLFMSATGDSFFKFLNEYFKKKRRFFSYKIQRDYSRIEDLYFFDKDESLKAFLDKEVQEHEKVLYFCNDVAKIYKLHKEYDDSIFIFSDPFVEKNGEYVKKSKEKGKNDRYAKKLDRVAIRKIIEDKTLHHKYTFTTTTLDNGVDLYGKDIKWIVCDNIRDFDTLIQCIGRKRFMEDDLTDKVSVIIRNINNQTLNGMRKRFSDTIREVNEFDKHGVKAKNRYSNADYCIYDTATSDKYKSRKRINYAKFTKIKSDWSIIDEILSDDKSIREIIEVDEKVAYIRRVANLLKQPSYKKIDDIYKKESIEDYLESVIGKVMLVVEDRNELIEKMDVKGQRELLKSMESLNAFLKEKKICYRIVQFETSRIIDGKKKKFKHSWKVVRHIE